MARPRFTLRTAAYLLAGLAVSLGSGCHELPRTPGKQVKVLEVGPLATVNPADVAVLPIEAEEGVVVPREMLREEIAAGLPARKYTPLSLEFVDTRVVEATYSYGAVGEEAVCQVTVHRWNERYWDANHSIDVDIVLRLIDPARPDGPALWAGRLTGPVDVSDLRNEVIEGKLYEKVIARVAQELLGALPKRQPAPGQR